jgi:hypothetical protein
VLVQHVELTLALERLEPFVTAHRCRLLLISRTA